jgi:hypothetical protein
MPDISMCLGRGCPSKDRCFRYVAPEDFDTQRGENGICKHFWDVSPPDDISDNGFIPTDKNGGRE